jgi:hypothetical protein
MTRNLKALGLALAAVFAMSALGASSAAAEPEFTGIETTTPGGEHVSTHVHTTIDGSQHGAEPDVFTLGSVSIRCNEAKYTGTSADGSDPTLTVTPTYSECKAAFTFVTHVEMNGCDYLFHAGTQVTAGMHYTGTVDIVCPENQSITLRVTTLAGATKCLIHIRPQTGLTGITYTVKTNASPPDAETDVTVDVEIPQITTETTGTSTNCGGLNEGHHGANDGNWATYHGEATITGTNTAKEAIDVEVSG